MRGDHPATREKDLGIWQTWTWAQVADEVRALACGLAALGFKRGMNLAIIGDNRPRLYWAMAAAQSLGGVPVPLYQDAVAEEMVYVLNDADIHFAIVEDQEQVDKMLEIRDRCPKLEHIIFDDPRGLRHYTQDFLHSYEGIQALGRAHHEAHPDFFLDAVAENQADDVAVMVYTSGTTGKPKGVCLTHTALITAARGGVEFDRLTPDEDVLSYLPMAWIGDHLFSYCEALVAGFTINCPESSDTVMTDLREIGPTFYFAPPRVFENLLTQVMIRMEDAGALKRCALPLLHGGGAPLRRRDPRRQAGHCRSPTGCSTARQRPDLWPAAQRARHEPDPRRLHRRRGHRARPLPLLPLDRHQHEAALRRDGDLRVRVPAARRRHQARFGRQAGARRRGEDRRQRRSAGAQRGDAEGVLQAARRHRRGRSTATAISTPGDAGIFDADGHLKIIDRAKDVGKLANGALFAPNYVENKLKFFSYIKEAVAFGARPRHGLRVHQHRHVGGRQLGGAARHRVFGLHRPRRPARRSAT